MNPLNLATTSSPPPVANDLLAKRKRGRPRKDESLTQPQQENPQVITKPDDNLVGKTISGVVEGSFDAGYILNVKVTDSDTKLRGLVFKPGRVAKVTPANDVAPRVKMCARGETKNQTDVERQSLPPSDQRMKGIVTDVEISESAQALSLMPARQSNDEEPKEAVMEEEPKEAVMEEEDGVKEGGGAETRLVEFFPTPDTTMVTAEQSLGLAQKETTEQERSLGEPRGFDLMAEDPVPSVEKVPEELKLELGNKMIMGGDNKESNNGTTMETEPTTSASKSGFIANLFEGEDKKSNSGMEEEATPSVQ